MRTSYQEKLLHPEWQKMRLKVLERDKFTCQCCYETERTLHVHHRYYVQGRDPWNYPMFALVTFCVDCHKSPEESDASIKYQSGFYDWEGQIGVLTSPPDAAKVSEITSLLCSIECYSYMRSEKKSDVIKSITFSIQSNPSVLDEMLNYFKSRTPFPYEAVVS